MDTNISEESNRFTRGDGAIDRKYNISSNTVQERNSWRDMATTFYTDVSDLFEKEGRLIRAEMNEKVTQVKVAIVSLVTSGIVLFIGAQCLAATVIILLANVVPLWFSAMIVTSAFLMIGGIMFAAAKKKVKARDLRPKKSIEAFDQIRYSLKEKVNEITKH